MTGDTVGGVGVFAVELARALVRRGHHVRIVLLGPGAADDLNERGAVELERLPSRLEWMGGEGDARALASEIESLRVHMTGVAECWRPDVLHTNHFAFAACAPGVPTLLGVHGDVISWWRVVRGQRPPAGVFHAWYAGLASSALRRAEAVVAPTRATLEDLRLSFGFAGGEVIAHGCVPEQFRRGLKRKLAVTLGRLWDDGKQAALLGRTGLAMPIVVAGDDRHPLGGSRVWPSMPGVECQGRVSRAEALALLARARVYIGTSCYEPFGLAPLEAAFSGCALLLNDIPTFREVWGPAACYFARNDVEALARELRCLADDVDWAAAMGEAAYWHARREYTAVRMAADYERIYARLAHAAPVPVATAAPQTIPPPPAMIA